MTTPTGSPEGPSNTQLNETFVPLPRTEGLDETETTHILREAFRHMATLGFDIAVTEQDGRTEIGGPEEDQNPTQP